MNNAPQQVITAEHASLLIKDGLPLLNFNVKGVIEFPESGYGNELTIINCTIEGLQAEGAEFEKPVNFKNTTFNQCKFNFAYFLHGLSITDCIFENTLSFAIGGHNQIGYPVNIENNIFFEFVDFWDCWYQGEVNIIRNHFSKGTNIESKLDLITFDIAPVIQNNTGKTDIQAKL